VLGVKGLNVYEAVINYDSLMSHFGTELIAITRHPLNPSQPSWNEVF